MKKKKMMKTLTNTGPTRIFLSFISLSAFSFSLAAADFLWGPFWYHDFFVEELEVKSYFSDFFRFLYEVSRLQMIC